VIHPYRPTSFAPGVSQRSLARQPADRFSSYSKTNLGAAGRLARSLWQHAR
jgi:hypothetical protein